jgi:CubicO group peptidase (beta-lactamase class C family)
VHQWVNEGVAQTIEVLVARKGTIVLHEVAGRLIPEADSPETPLNAIFPLASITKILTTTVLMTLIEEGRVGINRPVISYIPEFKGKGKEAVTVRHLLTHTSGLREEQVESYAKGQQEGRFAARPDQTIHPLVKKYLAERYGAPLSTPPGSDMSYADLNFDLLGEIARRISRTSLDLLGRSRVFMPLGMVDTHYCKVDADAKRRVRRSPDPPDLFSPPGPLSSASEEERVSLGSSFAVSTVLDMARLGQMFLNGGAYGRSVVLSPVTVGEVTRNQIPGIPAEFFGETFPEASWGYGWSVHGSKISDGSLYSALSFEHWGAGGTYTWVDPELEIVGVYFSSAARTTGMPPIEAIKHWRKDVFTDAVSASVEEL